MESEENENNNGISITIPMDIKDRVKYLTADADSTSNDIMSGKTAYVKGDKITGRIPDNGELNYTPSIEDQNIPEGYTSGGIISGVTKDIDQNITPINIRSGVTILGVEGNLIPDKPDQSKTVTPTTEQQVIVGDTGYELGQVTVEPVTKDIDNNIQSNNIRAGVSILGVEGNLIELQDQSKIVTPTTEQQIILPDNNYNALNSITVEAVTNDIDSNIKAGNIKKDIDILGITGTYEGLNTSDATATANDISDGKTAYINGQKVIGTNKTVIEYSYDNANFTFNLNLFKKIDLSNVILDSRVNSLRNAFFNLSKLEEIIIDENNFNTHNVTNMQQMFSGCEKLSNLYDVMSKIDTTNVRYMDQMFAKCHSITRLPEIYAGAVINIYTVFMGGSWPYFNKFTEFGGFKDLGKSYYTKTTYNSNYTLSFASYCNYLTHDSLVNIINGLYNLNLNTNLSVDGVCQYRQKLTLNTNQINMLSAEERAIATNKGWDIGT